MKPTILGAALAGALAAVAADARNPTEASTAPVSLEATYTGEVWRNISGGVARDGTYLDNFDLVASFDADRALRLSGTTFLASALYNNRHTFSDRIVGDLQVVSNIDTDGALRLYEAWVDHDFGPGALKFGLIDLNSEFDVNETGALFINSSHGIGPDFSQIGENGPGIFPITALGARLSFDLGERAELRAGVFEGTPGDHDHPRRTVIRLDGDEGNLLVGEAVFRPRDDIRIAIGAWRHDGRIPGPTVSERRTSSGGYAIAEGRLAEVAGRSLAAFLRVGFADGDVHQIAAYQGAGLALAGKLLGGEQHEEQLGLAIGSAANSRSYRRAGEALGDRVEHRETIVELTYRLRLAPWLALQPDLQYVMNPGTDPRIRNALAVGLRFEVGWSSGL